MTLEQTFPFSVVLRAVRDFPGRGLIDDSFQNFTGVTLSSTR